MSILKFPFGAGEFGVLGAPGALRKHRYLPLRSHFEASNIRYLPLRRPSGLRVLSENIGIYRSGAISRLRKYGIYRSGRQRGSGYPPKTSNLPLRSHFEASEIRYLPLRMPSGLWKPSENVGICCSRASSRFPKYRICRSCGFRGSGYPPLTLMFIILQPLQRFQNTLFTVPEPFERPTKKLFTPGTILKLRAYVVCRSRATPKFKKMQIDYRPKQ